MKTTQELRNHISTLSSSELLSQIRERVAEERRIQAEFLVYLERIEAIGLHLQMAYSSLHDFMTRELGFSEGAAQRRIQALYLMKAVPETKTAIETGSVSLSSASQLQTFFRNEAKMRDRRYTPQEKRALLQSIQGKSRRETEKRLAAISPQAVLPPEKERSITESKTQITAILDSEVVEQLDRLRELLAHHRPAPQGYGELIAFMAREALNKYDPERKKLRSKAEKPVTPPAVKREVNPAPISSFAALSQNQRRIPAALARAVRERDGGRCSWTDPATQKRCESRHALEIAHVIPFSRGGKTVLENLRTLCSSHHRYVTIQAFGAEKMGRYWKKETA